jgi:CelD/BcsL family acetyltransferase involved in cellulose biosynthesis
VRVTALTISALEQGVVAPAYTPNISGRLKQDKLEASLGYTVKPCCKKKKKKKKRKKGRREGRKGERVFCWSDLLAGLLGNSLFISS